MLVLEFIWYFVEASKNLQIVVVIETDLIIELYKIYILVLGK